jgi:hypothetical protein
LLNAEVVDIPTTSMDLDEELGMYIPQYVNEEVIENTQENNEGQTDED